MVWECGHQVFSLSSFSTGRDAYLKYIYFKLKTLLKKISGTRCISTDKGRLLNLFNLKLKMLQNLYFDLKSHLVTYFRLPVLHPNLLHKIKRCGFFKLVLGRMNWHDSLPRDPLFSHSKDSQGSCQFMVNLCPLLKMAFMTLSDIQYYVHVLSWYTNL